MDDYLDAFVQENEEHITTLNNALLDLENDPDDGEAMERIFRTAHTLKGNCGAMGFGDASDLAHAMEDLLDAMREGAVPVTGDTMDLVFDGVDGLEAMLEEVAAEGEPRTDPADIIDGLRGAIEEADAIEAGETRTVAAPGESTIERLLGRATPPDDGDVYSVRIALAEPNANEATAVVGGLDDAFAVLATDPPMEDIETGEFGESVDVAIEATVGREDLRVALEGIDRVVGTTVTDVTDRVGEVSGPAIETGDAEVDAALAEVDEFDLAAAESGDDEILDLEGGGSFDDLEADLGLDEEAESADPAAVTGDAEVDAALAEVDEFDDLQSAGDAVEDAGEFPDPTADANERFQALKEEVEQVEFEELEAEMEGMEFEGVATEEEVSFEELVGDGVEAAPGAEEADDAEEEPRTEKLDEIQTVRVDVEEIDTLYGYVEEMVTNRIRLDRAVEDGDLAAARDELDDLETLLSQLQDTVMDIRLVPLASVAGNLPRVVRDLARSQDKEVDFRMVGETVELDRSILDDIRDPLLHIVRNAVDHGIEPPAVRAEAGKDREGSVVLRAERSRDRVTIAVEDDGRGMDPGVIRDEAVDQGLVTRGEAESMDDDEIFDLLFESGFSTSEEVTEYSGRGVGMDVVHSTVENLDGSVSVDSEPGEGTTVELVLPVSMAIVDVLFVQTGDEQYGIPTDNVDEITRMDETRTVDGQEVLTHDEEVYPLMRLGEALGVSGTTANGDGKVIRIDNEVRQIALHCDDVRAQEEVVVKPFEGLLAGIPGLSGATVLGEGDVVTILDVETL